MSSDATGEMPGSVARPKIYGNISLWIRHLSGPVTYFLTQILLVAKHSKYVRCIIFHFAAGNETTEYFSALEFWSVVAPKNHYYCYSQSNMHLKRTN